MPSLTLKIEMRDHVAFDAPLWMGRKWGAELSSLNPMLDV